jgi:hypothetical protein
MLTRSGSRRMILMVVLLVVAGICSAQQQPSVSAPQPPAEPAVAPEALATLEKMGGFLRTLKAYTLHADSTIDEVLDDTGQKIQFGGTVDFHVRAPDRLRVEVASDRKQRQAFYDGTTLTLYGQRTKYNASAPAPPTIRAMLEVAEQKYGLEFPLADLFFWGTDKARPEDIKTALYVGPSVIGGVLCDHYAFRQEESDWQLWVERSDTPLPRKLVITTTNEVAQPQFVAVLTWNLTPQFDDAMFTFVPPADAHKITFREVATPTPGKQ